MYILFIILCNLSICPLFSIAAGYAGPSIAPLDSPFSATGFDIERELFPPTNDALTNFSLTTRVALLEAELLKQSRLIRETIEDKAKLQHELVTLKKQKAYDREILKQFLNAQNTVLEQLISELSKAQRTDEYNQDFGSDPDEQIDIEYCSDEESSQKAKRARNR